jgi:hypothetical protein
MAATAQLATVGKPTMGSSLKGAMVSWSAPHGGWTDWIEIFGEKTQGKAL